MKAIVVGVPGDVIYTISLIMYMVPIGKLVVDGATYMQVLWFDGIVFKVWPWMEFLISIMYTSLLRDAYVTSHFLKK